MDESAVGSIKFRLDIRILNGFLRNERRIIANQLALTGLRTRRSTCICWPKLQCLSFIFISKQYFLSLVLIFRYILYLLKLEKYFYFQILSFINVGHSNTDSFIMNSSFCFNQIRRLSQNKFKLKPFKKAFSYDDAYYGKFDYHDRNMYPRRLSSFKEEELLDEIHAIKSLEIENPSPFHVVRRINSMSQMPWSQKVTLRRLNLHSQANGECVIVPNTPQFNALILKVKHLLQLKPARFENGKMPTEEDIGAIKVCPYTGWIKIDEKLRLQANRLNIEKPTLFQGNHLRGKINRMYGLSYNHYMK